MSENMKYWNELRRAPKDALKEIKGGRLSGMTDINPMWRYEKLTELFGPCGNGWKYKISRLWREDGADGEALVFAEVELSIGDMVIPGVGGSKIVAKEKSGMHSNDEAYKMAVTDALSTAMKMIGVGADVYRGRWDGSKYIEDKPSEKPKAVGNRKLFDEYHNKVTNMEELKKLAEWAGRHDWGGATGDIELALEVKGKELTEAQNVG